MPAVDFACIPDLIMNFIEYTARSLNLTNDKGPLSKFKGSLGLNQVELAALTDRIFNAFKAASKAELLQIYLDAGAHSYKKASNSGAVKHLFKASALESNKRPPWDPNAAAPSTPHLWVCPRAIVPIWNSWLESQGAPKSAIRDPTIEDDKSLPVGTGRWLLFESHHDCMHYWLGKLGGKDYGARCICDKAVEEDEAARARKKSSKKQKKGSKKHKGAAMIGGDHNESDDSGSASSSKKHKGAAVKSSKSSDSKRARKRRKTNLIQMPLKIMTMMVMMKCGPLLKRRLLSGPPLLHQNHQGPIQNIVVPHHHLLVLVSGPLMLLLIPMMLS